MIECLQPNADTLLYSCSHIFLFSHKGSEGSFALKHSLSMTPGREVLIAILGVPTHGNKLRLSPSGLPPIGYGAIWRMGPNSLRPLLAKHVGTDASTNGASTFAYGKFDAFFHCYWLDQLN